MTLSLQVSHLNPMTNSIDTRLPTREYPIDVPPTRRVGFRGECRQTRASIHHLRVFRGKARMAHTFYSSLNAGHFGSNFTQTKLLLTFDPRALHAIYVKDQDVYEESDIFISYDLLKCMYVASIVTDVFTGSSGSASVLGCFLHWVSLSLELEWSLGVHRYSC